MGTILPVLTDGHLDWDDTTATLRVDESCAAPPALVAALNGEPRYVDLRWARAETHPGGGLCHGR